MSNKGRLQKKCDNCHMGGGPDVKMSHFIKLCLKSISSHSELAGLAWTNPTQFYPDKYTLF